LNTNETRQTIEARRSTRNFSSREIHEDDLIRILESANQAPSAHNKQSWRFIVIRGARKRALASLVNESASQFKKPSSTLLRMASRSISSDPVVIAVVNTGELVNHGTQSFEGADNLADLFRTMEIQSSAAAVQNMILAAASLGLGSVWLGILCLIKDEVLRLLEVREGEFMAVVPIGYAQGKSSAPRKKSLNAIVSFLS
jgi:nitroreductase